MASNFVDLQVMKFTLNPTSVGTFLSTDVDIANDQVHIASHGLATGTPISLTTTGAVPTGLAVDTIYYAIAVDLNKVAFATSLANAQAGTKINLTAVGTSTATMYKNSMGNIPLGIIPDNFIITRSFYDVVNTFTSATDAATIALTVEGAGDIKAAIAISDGTNVWDSGIHVGLAGVPALSVFHASNNPTALELTSSIATSYIQTSAVRTLLAVVAVEGLTAGKLNLYIEGVTSEE